MDINPVSATGQKRPSQPGQQPRSRKNVRTYAIAARQSFQPTSEDLEFLKANGSPKLSSLMRPKGRMEYGIRIDFGAKPRLLNEILANFSKIYPAATSYHLYVESALIDLGFPNENLAEQAINTPFCIDNVVLPCVRTRSPRDISIQVRLDSLPTTMKLDELESGLNEGLKAYGKVLSLNIATDPRVPHLAGSHAIATIVPTAEAGKRGEHIPCVAYLEPAKNEPFLIAPMGTPFSCGTCFNLGHLSSRCTASTEQLLNRSKGILWGLLKQSNATTKPVKQVAPCHKDNSEIDTLASVNLCLNPALQVSPVSKTSTMQKPAPVYNLPKLPALKLPSNLDIATAESITEYRELIQNLLNKLAQHMLFLGHKTKHTRSTQEAVKAINELRPEIEAAIVSYLAELDELELKVSLVDPVFNYALDEMHYENPYLETLEEQSQGSIYGLTEPPSLLFSD